MLKTVALTIALAASAGYVGYNSDEIISNIGPKLMHEIDAVRSYFAPDHEAVLRRCIRERVGMGAPMADACRTAAQELGEGFATRIVVQETLAAFAGR